MLYEPRPQYLKCFLYCFLFLLTNCRAVPHFYEPAVAPVSAQYQSSGLNFARLLVMLKLVLLVVFCSMGIQDLLTFIFGEKQKKVEYVDVALIEPPLVGKFLAVDVSCYMHSFCALISTARPFHQKPPVCLQSNVSHYMDQQYRYFKELNIGWIFVFDGLYHTMKEDENSSRSDTRKLNLDIIDNLYLSGNAEDKQDVSRLEKSLKAATYPREDIIANFLVWAKLNDIRTVGAPFEADWQLLELERSGIAAGILTVDSDLIPLGGELVILKHDNTLKLPCQVAIRSQVLETADMEEADFLRYCFLLGTDYLLRIPGNGKATVLKLMRKWQSRNEEIEFVDFVLASVPTKVNNSEFKVKYRERWQLNENLFLYPPVFRIFPCSNDGTDTEISQYDAFFNGDYDVKLVPVNQPAFEGEADEAEVDTDQNCWAGNLIGFDPVQMLASAAAGKTVKHVLEGVEDLRPVGPKDFFNMSVWIRTGSPPQKILCPLIGQHYYTIGSYIDFSAIPLEWQHTGALLEWLGHRKVPLPKALAKRSDVDKEVKKYRLLANKDADDIEDIPPPYCRVSSADGKGENIQIGRGSYLSWDMLFVDQTIVWKSDGVESVIRYRLPLLDDTYLDGIFGDRKNGIRTRAMNHVKGGGFDISTLRFTDNAYIEQEDIVIEEAAVVVVGEGGGEVDFDAVFDTAQHNRYEGNDLSTAPHRRAPTKAAATTTTATATATTATATTAETTTTPAPPKTTRTKTRRPVLIISCECTPSMKADNYSVYLVFDAARKEYMPSPISRCGCPAGRLFCSHMLGLCLILYGLQINHDLSLEEYKLLLPEPVKTIQSLGISVNYVFTGNRYNQRKGNTHMNLKTRKISNL
jgi:5'-3' exonuclease